MNTLKELFSLPIPNGIASSDKDTFHDYIRIYDRILLPYKNTTNNVLEIGIYQGHSTQMFAKYFTKAENVYGMDIADMQTIYVNDPRIKIVINDATKAENLNFLSNLDVVIDDASHMLDDQINTLKLLWPRLNTNAIYIIEDFQKPRIAVESFKNDPFLKSLDGYFIDIRHTKDRYDDFLFVAYKD